jgi:hypothetical protein
LAGLRRCLTFSVFRAGVAVRSFLLVRRVRMILGLEVLGLVRRTYANAKALERMGRIHGVPPPTLTSTQIGAPRCGSPSSATVPARSAKVAFPGKAKASALLSNSAVTQCCGWCLSWRARIVFSFSIPAVASTSAKPENKSSTPIRMLTLLL